MLLSCAEQMLGDRPLAERLAIVCETGFDGVDLRWSTIVDPKARRMIERDGIAVGAVYSQLREPSLLSRRASERGAAIEGLVERARVAVDLGAPILIVVPVFGDAQVRGFDPLLGLAELETALLLALLGEVAEGIAGWPLTVAIEPLNRAETHFLTDPVRAAAICDAIASPRIATMVDTYHCDRMGQDIPATIAAVGKRLALVHLSDTDRRLPGEGGVDFGSVLAALRRRDYGGWLGLECRPVESIAALHRSVLHLRGLASNDLHSTSEGDAQ